MNAIERQGQDEQSSRGEGGSEGSEALCVVPVPADDDAGAVRAPRADASDSASSEMSEMAERARLGATRDAAEPPCFGGDVASGDRSWAKLTGPRVSASSWASLQDPAATAAAWRETMASAAPDTAAGEANAPSGLAPSGLATSALASARGGAMAPAREPEGRRARRFARSSSEPWAAQGLAHLERPAAQDADADPDQDARPRRFARSESAPEADPAARVRQLVHDFAMPWRDVAEGSDDFEDDEVTTEVAVPALRPSQPAVPPPSNPREVRADSSASAPDAPDALDAPAVPAVSHKMRRHRRTRPRGTTIAMKRVTLADLALGTAMYPPVELDRPRTRGECGSARPCPWISCKHHLYLDINPITGSIKLNFPDREAWELEHSCSLDVADTGAKTLDEIGEITNLTRERIRQVEVRGLIKLRTRRELR